MKAPFGANMFLTALNHLSCCSSDSGRNCSSSSNQVASTQRSGVDPASALRGRKTCNTRHSRIKVGNSEGLQGEVGYTVCEALRRDDNADFQDASVVTDVWMDIFTNEETS